MPVEVASDEAQLLLTHDSATTDVVTARGRIAVTDDDGSIIVLLTSTAITLELSTSTQAIST